MESSVIIIKYPLWRVGRIRKDSVYKWSKISGSVSWDDDDNGDGDDDGKGDSRICTSFSTPGT